MAFDKARFGLSRLLWWVQKRIDERKQPTAEQAESLNDYYKRAVNIFRGLGIDVLSKPSDVQRLYFMTLLYIDNKEAICPSRARTASLIGFLDSLDTGWALPPSSAPVSKEFAEEVDGYMAVEMLRNHLGLNDIREEILAALKNFDAEKAIADALRS